MDNWLFYLVYLVVDFLLLLGAASLILTLPGTWMMVVVVALSRWLLPSYTPYDWGFVGIILAIAVVAEIIEFFSGVVGVKKKGGSKKASWGALVGGLVGAIGGAPLLPPIGPLVGLLVGTFLGAWLMERDLNPTGSRNVAMGATIARFWGLMGKFAAAAGILTLVVYKQWLSL